MTVPRPSGQPSAPASAGVQAKGPKTRNRERREVFGGGGS